MGVSKPDCLGRLERGLMRIEPEVWNDTGDLVSYACPITGYNLGTYNELRKMIEGDVK